MGDEGSADSMDPESTKNLGRMSRQPVAFARVRVHYFFPHRAFQGRGDGATGEGAGRLVARCVLLPPRFLSFEFVMSSCPSYGNKSAR